MDGMRTSPLLANERDDLLDEQRVPVGHRDDPLAQRGIRPAVRIDELGALRRRQRLEQNRGRVQLAPAPGRPRIEELRARETEQHQRRAAREVGDVIDQVEEHRLAPLHVIEDDDQRAVAGELLELRPHRPEELAGSRAAVGHLRERSGGGRSRLLEHRDERPECDPLAVAEAAPSEHGRVDAVQELGCQPRLAEACGAEDSEEVAAALPYGALVGPAQLLELGVAADERCVQPAGDRQRLGIDVEQAKRRHRLGLAASVDLPRLDAHGIAHRRRVASPISTSPSAASCSRRAATLTASPVTRVSPSPARTLPVFTPMRAPRPSAATSARISHAARTARSASSSCATGTPKTAITASPMNFSTVPPWRSRIVRMPS